MTRVVQDCFADWINSVRMDVTLFGICLGLLQIGVCISIPTEPVEISAKAPPKPFETNDYFLSFCLDPYLKHDLPVPWGNFSFDHPRVLTLARGLSPAILRWGGTDADWSIFYPDKPSSNQPKKTSEFDMPNKKQSTVFEQNRVSDKAGFMVPIYKEDVDNLRKLAKAAGGKLLYDLNIQLRKGDDWNSSNAIEIMKHVISTTDADTVEDVVFELGNEWPYAIYHPTPERLAQDFVQLNQTLFSFPQFANSFIVGPDLGTTTGMSPSFWQPIISGFVKGAKGFVSAVTIHHYYFQGPGGKLDEYFDLKYFDGLEYILVGVRKTMDEQGGQNIPLWLGETSDSYQKGTPDITNRFAGGFLWLDKLGLAASVGVSLVARQDFYGGNYPFLDEDLQPNPDYWLSYVYKRLVGNRVLMVKYGGSNTTRIYAHCTSERGGYAPGSVTFFALNIGTDSSMIKFEDGKQVDVFELSPGDAGSLVSSKVLINGEQIQLIDDDTLPLLKPKTIDAKDGLVVKAKTIVFWVMKDVAYEGCMN